MENLYFAAGIVFVVTSLIWFLVLLQVRAKLRHKADLLQVALSHTNADINNQVLNRSGEMLQHYKDQVAKLENKCITLSAEGFEKGRREARAEFERDYYVMVNPVKEVYEEGLDLLLYNSKKKMVNIGYQYQLHVKGIPVFEPSYVPVETYEFKDAKLDQQNITKLISAAIEAYKPAGSAFIKVSDKILSLKSE